MNDIESLAPEKTLLLTETEAARILGFSPRTLQKWRIRGDGPSYIKLCDGKGPVRYRRRELDSFLDDRLRHSTSDTGDAE